MSVTPESVNLQVHLTLFPTSRLAELVRQQHRVAEQRESEVKPSVWPDRHTSSPSPPSQDQPGPLLEDQSRPLEDHPRPLDLIKGRCSGGEEESGPTPLSRRKSLSPGLSPGSPAGSTGSADSAGREFKRRRLDELLNKKFDTAGSAAASPTRQIGGQETDEASAAPRMKPGSPTAGSLSADPLTNSQIERRGSQVDANTFLFENFYVCLEYFLL